jgi:oligo-1,6-glucosidase
MTVIQHPWWKDGVVYQIYPASYKDSNGDGWGDIKGIISKVPYLKELGVDIVWMCPMYESPQYDMGYDISNYEAVDSRYGTVEDVEELVQELHSRGMRLILDLVINHTSHEHAWFKESRSSKTNPKRDWYIWRPAKYNKDGERMPPNNWRSNFGGSAWTFDETTGEYYLHLFAPEQPDLNWENDETREAIYNSAMRFWLDRGVDGFRIDTVNMYSKGTELPDAPIVDPNSFAQPAAGLFCNGPRMHEFLQEMNAKVLDHYDAMTVGELPHTPDPAHVLRYIGAKDRQLNMVFQFDIVDLGIGKIHKYDFEGHTLLELKNVVTKWQTFIAGTDAWTTAFCENHDQGRSVSRYTSDAPEWREVSAKMLAIMMTTLTGTLYVYQGQEIGMINAPKDWPITDYKDIESLNYYNMISKRSGNDPEELSRAFESIQILGRDHARLPMHWDASEHAGFTTADHEGPWMRVHDLYPEINVASQLKKPDSVLNFWKSMLAMRKEYKDLFVHGDFRLYDPSNENTFTYAKVQGGKMALVVLNFTEEEQKFEKPEELAGRKWERLVSNYPEGKEDVLKGFEGRVYLVQ